MARSPRTTARAQRVVVGVDIGGSKVAMMASEVDSGTELVRARFPTPDMDPESFLTVLFGEIVQLLGQARVGPERLAALGVAVPGPVEPREGRVIDAGNLEGWREVPFKEMLTKRFGVPVFVEHDANAAAIGERWRGCAEGLDDFVFLALGTGLGAGIFLNGKLYRGHRHAAGEIGNFVVRRRRLGRRRETGEGDLARIVGGKNIKRAAKRILGERVNVEQILQRGKNDRRLDKIVARLVDHVAIAVVNIAALLDPQAIVFGGGTASAGRALLDPVRARVEDELEAPPAMIHSILGEDAQLHGVVRGALETLERPQNALKIVEGRATVH